MNGSNQNFTLFVHGNAISRVQGIKVTNQLK